MADALPVFCVKVNNVEPLQALFKSFPDNRPRFHRV
jgi:hypothetical protein